VEGREGGDVRQQMHRARSYQDRERGARGRKKTEKIAGEFFTQTACLSIYTPHQKAPLLRFLRENGSRDPLLGGRIWW